MHTRLKALGVLSVGGLLTALGAGLPGNPQAPFSLGGVPQPFYTGTGAGYVVGGGIAYVVSGSGRTPPFRQLFRATLLAIPLAFVLAAGLRYLTVGSVTTTGRFLAFHLGLAFLFYPVAFGLAFGYGPDQRDRALVRVAALLALVSLVVLVVMNPQGGLAGAAFLFGFVAIVVVDIVAAYPVYRLGRELTPVSEAPRPRDGED